MNAKLKSLSYKSPKVMKIILLYNLPLTNRKLIIFIIIFCLFIFTSCGKKNPIQVNYYEIDNTDIEEIYWGENVIKVKGSGVCPDSPEYTEGQRRLMARRVAIADSYRKAYDVVYRIEILDKDGKTTTIGDEVSSDDILKTKIKSYIINSQTVSEQFFSDKCLYEVILQNKLNGENGLSEIVGQEIMRQWSPYLSHPWSLYSELFY